MKISAVCFDLGKVLLDFDKEAMLVRMAEKSPLAPEEIARLIQEDPLGPVSYTHLDVYKRQRPSRSGPRYRE